MGNRLKDETSPYLLQHAENPVDWFPWGEEAFAVAQAEDKPIFLSVGYAACHWCHVMAHESFEDPEIAAIMNEVFVNIKVDREERPDVDSIYMDAVVAMTGHGGWPMSVFLTPLGEPFYGGTYFPPSPRYNMPSFQDVLLLIAKQWQESREQLLTTGRQLKEHIDSSISLLPTSGRLDRSSFDRAAETLFKTYDWTNGGWGGAPKFPQASAIEFLLRKHHRDGDKLALEMATHALQAMARGGIYDHLAGGFHRYTVDSHWLVPHFEKMLYDNALLAQTYLHAWQITGDAILRQVVESTLNFLIRDMRHPEGGFYSALDADSEGEEGKFYVWTPSEIRDHLGDESLAEHFITAYGVTEEGNFEGSNILYRPQDDRDAGDLDGVTSDTLSEQLTSAKLRLLAHREKRVHPAADDKVLTAWNGLLLTTLAEAAHALERTDYLEAAQSLADFLLDTMLKDGKLHRAWRTDQTRFIAYLEDHAALGEGLLALYQTDFDPRWYSAARDQAEEILAHFTDPAGGFFDTRDDHEKLITRPKSFQDSPIPSGNSLAISLLLKLAALTGESRYSEPAESALRAMQDNALRYPTAFAGWLCAIDFAIGPQLQVALIGTSTDADFNALANVIHERYLPRLVVAGAEEGAQEVPALLEGRGIEGTNASAYLCQRFTCKLPTTSPEVLLEQIEAALSSDPR